MRVNMQTSDYSNYLPTVLEKLDKLAPEFKGDGRKLALYVGIAVITKHYGWRVTKIIWGNHTWESVKETLELDIEAIAPPETKLSKKNLGYQAWKKTGDFWRVLKSKKGFRPENGKIGDMI